MDKLRLYKVKVLGEKEVHTLLTDLSKYDLETKLKEFKFNNDFFGQKATLHRFVSYLEKHGKTAWTGEIVQEEITLQ